MEADGVDACVGACAITRADGDVTAITKMAVAEMILRFKSTLLCTSGLKREIRRNASRANRDKSVHLPRHAGSGGALLSCGTAPSYLDRVFFLPPAA
jgi:hypothetical protein